MKFLDLQFYDKFIVTFSGGKDCTACFLWAKEQGIPLEKIELWHHCVDGQEKTFMDWEITEDYCRKFAAAFGVPIYFSWRDGGFLKEMLRDGSQPTGDVFYENPDGLHRLKSKPTSTVRLRFPQIGAIESGRWCSPILKIDVAKRILNNDPRFKGIKTCFITGERAEESDPDFESKPFEKRKGRGSYQIIEPHYSSKDFRVIDTFRPIRDWKREKVWALIEKYKIRVHPCYYLGWGRCSCKFCIFGNANQMASAFHISPNEGNYMVELEKQFGHTMKRIGKNNVNLASFIEKGTPYPSIDEFWTAIALSDTYELDIIMNEWYLPAGAYGESCGPT